ncbi:hypothetical protein FBU30_011287 [Linnemannia zychae]|nr:hypothetical protein FBU30_011287 [Linnemannia zychae]
MSSRPSPQFLAHLEWVLDKVAGEEHVTFQNFVNHFDLSDRLSATSLYQSLITCKEIRKSRREKLQESFAFFRKHGETRFWAKRAVTVSSEVVANRALVSVQEFGQLQSQTILDQCASATPKFLAHSNKEDKIEGVEPPQDSARSTDTTTTAFGHKLSSIDRESISLLRTPVRMECSIPFPSTIVDPDHIKAWKIVSNGAKENRKIYHPEEKNKGAMAHFDGGGSCTVDLPELDIHDEDMSPNRSKLYQLALQNLYNAKTLQMQPHFDRAHCLEFKDAFYGSSVSLSGIWNTYSITANNLFGTIATAEAKAFCYMRSMDEKDDTLMEIAAILLEKKSLEEVLDETYRLQVTQPTHRRMLDVVRIIGEQGCSASALSKSKMADIFETGTSARKCDGLLSVSLVEVGNFEFKRDGASKPEVACQLRKNIKINKSILLELDKYELECPLLLSVHGMSAIVFRVRKWHDIWVAGRASRTIVLPSTFDEFRFFLGSQVHQLASLLSHYHEYAAQADQLFQQYRYQKKGEDEEDTVSPTPKSVNETLDWEQIVFHTPTKASKRPSLLDKFKQAKEEADRSQSEDEADTSVKTRNEFSPY